jgi:hypothetical protein
MSSSKKLTCKGTLWQVLICLRPRIPYPPPHYTLYVHESSIPIHRGGGGVELNQREKGRGATVHKANIYQHD